jgi:DNA-binding FadR family transcriptional regulator
MLAPQRSATDGLMPLKSGRKSDEVFEQISDSIRAGRFAVGEKLPPERDLASIFQTSRQTIREALYRAELIGLIEVRHGAGSFVVSASPREPTGEPLEDLIRREVHRAAEFFEIRRALEGWCAGQAAKMATRSDLTALRAPLDAMKKLDVTDERWEANDIAFHAALAQATGNPLAIRMMQVLRDGFAAFYRLKRFIPSREEQRVIWRHHYDIYDGVRRKDPETARQALIDHMDFVERKLGESLSDI